MLKLMEASMAAGLTFTWDAHFGYLKFGWYNVHMNLDGIYDVRNKNNTLATFESSADGVVGFIVGGLN